MYLEGSEYVTYTPVDAYAVMPMVEGIISGGGGDEATIVEKTRFYWVYDPNNLGKSGFTGCGKWFCGEPNTPLAKITEDQLLSEFSTGTRTSLNAEFQEWQELVASQTPGETDYVKNFINMLVLAGGGDCYSTNPAQ